MIRVTRLNGQEMVLNADLIETVEGTPDTVISLTTGRKVLVREPPAEITRRVLAYRRRVAGRWWGSGPAVAGRRSRIRAAVAGARAPAGEAEQVADGPCAGR